MKPPANATTDTLADRTFAVLARHNVPGVVRS